MSWGRKWFNLRAGQTHYVASDHSNNSGTIDKILDRSISDEISSFKKLILSRSSKFN